MLRPKWHVSKWLEHSQKVFLLEGWRLCTFEWKVILSA